MAGPKVTLKFISVRQVLIVVLVSVAMSAVTGAIVAAVVQSEENEALRQSAILGCDGTNLLRGDALLLVHRGRPTYPDPQNLADWLLRVRDCERTYDRQRVVICPAGAEYRFLQDLARHHRVALRDQCTRLLPMR